MLKINSVTRKTFLEVLSFIEIHGHFKEHLQEFDCFERHSIEEFNKGPMMIERIRWARDEERPRNEGGSEPRHLEL